MASRSHQCALAAAKARGTRLGARRKAAGAVQRTRVAPKAPDRRPRPHPAQNSLPTARAGCQLKDNEDSVVTFFFGSSSDESVLVYNTYIYAIIGASEIKNGGRNPICVPVVRVKLAISTRDPYIAAIDSFISPSSRQPPARRTEPWDFRKTFGFRKLCSFFWNAAVTAISCLTVRTRVR
jgi:hypothetical protein